MKVEAVLMKVCGRLVNADMGFDAADQPGLSASLVDSFHEGGFFASIEGKFGDRLDVF